MQDVEFARDGDVSYREYLYFEPGLGCTNSSSAANLAGPGADGGGSDGPRGRGRRAATGAPGAEQGGLGPESHGPPRCGRDDIITTLNLPLLGVLRAVDKATAFKSFVEVAINQFFDRRKASGKFDGLFMHRCVCTATCPHACAHLHRSYHFGSPGGSACLLRLRQRSASTTERHQRAPSVFAGPPGQDCHDVVNTVEGGCCGALAVFI